MIKQTNVLFLTLLLVMVATVTNAQNGDQHITVTVAPPQSVEQRVADSIKEKELREAAENKLASEKSARIASNSPKLLLSRGHTFYISSDTSYFEPVQLQNALRKRSEFDDWQMAIIEGWDKRNIADVLIEVDRPVFTFTFTYTVTDRSTGMLLTSGKVTAFDGNAAAPLLAKRIIEDITKARREALNK